MTGLELRRRVMLSMKEQGLPSAYQEVRYLQSDGNQYINSGFAPRSNGGEFTFDVDFVTNNTGQTDMGALIGSRSATATRNWILVSRTVHQAGYGNSYQNITNNNFSWANAKAYISGNTYIVAVTVNDVTQTTSFAKQTFNNTANVYLFSANDRGALSSYRFKGYIKAAKLYDNGIMVRDFIPCYRKPDNVAGMYDIISRTFYTNAGTGEFIVGADV